MTMKQDAGTPEECIPPTATPVVDDGPLEVRVYDGAPPLAPHHLAALRQAADTGHMPTLEKVTDALVEQENDHDQKVLLLQAHNELQQELLRESAPPEDLDESGPTTLQRTRTVAGAAARNLGYLLGTASGKAPITAESEAARIQAAADAAAKAEAERIAQEQEAQRVQAVREADQRAAQEAGISPWAHGLARGLAAGRQQLARGIAAAQKVRQAGPISEQAKRLVAGSSALRRTAPRRAPAARRPKAKLKRAPSSTRRMVVRRQGGRR